MRVAIGEDGRPIVIDEKGDLVGEVRSITFPTITIPTSTSDVHRINRGGSITGDVTLDDGTLVSNVRLSIG